MNNCERTRQADEDELRNSLKVLFGHQRLAVLSSSGSDHPYASLVAFANSDDLSRLYFCTGRATRKFANLVRDPAVSMLIDNRSNQARDFQEAMAVTAIGRASEASPAEEEEFRSRYLAKHPSLEDFVKAPGTGLMVIEVEAYYLVTRFQNVMELHLKP